MQVRIFKDSRYAKIRKAIDDLVYIRKHILTHDDADSIRAVDYLIKSLESRIR